jgi:hypothetical protein
MTMLNQMKEVGYVSVTNITEGTAGAVVWWRLAGNVRSDVLEQAWLAAGLSKDWLPPTVTPAVALRRAMNAAAMASHLIRPQPGGGLAMVYEGTVAGELRYAVVVKASIDKVGRLTVSDTSTNATYDEVTETVEVEFQRALDTLDTTDISSWFSSLMTKLQAVSLRDSGGVYFVPRQALGMWEKIVAVIRKVSAHVVAYIPAMPTAEALSAITEALSQEAETMMANIQADVDSGNLGKRALESRANRAQECETKIAQYESILGVKQALIREKLEALQNHVNMSILSFEAQDS